MSRRSLWKDSPTGGDGATRQLKTGPFYLFDNFREPCSHRSVYFLFLLSTDCLQRRLSTGSSSFLNTGTRAIAKETPKRFQGWSASHTGVDTIFSWVRPTISRTAASAVHRPKGLLGCVLVGLLIGGLSALLTLSVYAAQDAFQQLLQGSVRTHVILGVLVVKWFIWAVSLGCGRSAGVLAPLLMVGGALGV